MINPDFSITHRLLDALQEHDQNIGRVHSFFAVHIGGGLAAVITSALDVIIHLALSIVKIVTGIIATPLYYFTDSPYAEQWTWTIAGQHFMEAVKHAVSFIAAPTATFLFSPGAALDLCFHEKEEIKRLQENVERQGQRVQSNQRIKELQERVEELEDQLEEQEVQTRAAEKELSSLKDQQRAAEENVHELMDQLQKRAQKKSSSSLESSDDQETIKLKDDLRVANEKILELEAQISESEKNVRLNIIEEEDNVSTITELKRQLTELQDNLSVLKIEILTKDEELEHLKELNNKEDKQYHTILNEKFDLEEKIKEGNGNDRVLANLQLELQQLQRQNTVLQHQVDDQKTEIHKEGERVARIIEERNNTNKEKSDEIARLEGVVAENAEIIKNLKAVPLEPSAIPEELKKAAGDLADLVTCAIELDLLKTALVIKGCMHSFNEEYLLDHFKRGTAQDAGQTCPTCRFEVKDVKNKQELEANKPMRDIAKQFEIIHKITHPELFENT